MWGFENILTEYNYNLYIIFKDVDKKLKKDFFHALISEYFSF